MGMSSVFVSLLTLFYFSVGISDVKSKISAYE